LFITLEAIQRFVNLEAVTDPLDVVYVGCAGVAINFIGLLVFAGSGGHGHSHGGGHGHQSHDDNHGHKQDKTDDHKTHDDPHDRKQKKDSHKHAHQHSHEEEGHKHDKEDHKEHHDHDNKDSSREEPAALTKARNDNMYAVFLHVLSDFLVSLAAILSGLLIHFLSFQGRYYFDPALSLFIVLLILRGSVPLVLKGIHVFMQRVPTYVDVPTLNADLGKVPGVISIHELHVWTLVGNKSIGSVHVSCLDHADFMDIAFEMKKIFHKHNVHSTTIQPEFLHAQALKKKRERCQLGCLKEDTCKTESCCPPTYDDALGDDELLRLTNDTKPRKRYRKTSTRI